MKRQIRFASISEKGLRENNEDLCVVKYLDDNYLLCICIDGVGGENGGEIAASIAAETITKYLESSCQPDLSDLRMAVIAANNSIIEMQVNPRLAHMSCVLTTCLFDIVASTLHICHVGDTRLYIHRHDGHLSKITPDHSWVGRMLDSGQISEEEAMNHPRRNMISRALGVQRLDWFCKYVFADSISTENIDLILLTTDGIYDIISSDRMNGIIVDKEQADEIANALVDRAISGGSHDNCSVIVVRL